MVSRAYNWNTAETITSTHTRMHYYNPINRRYSTTEFIPLQNNPMNRWTTLQGYALPLSALECLSRGPPALKSRLGGMKNSLTWNALIPEGEKCKDVIKNQYIEPKDAGIRYPTRLFTAT